MRTTRRVYRRAPVAPRRTTVRRQAFGNFASAMQQRDATNVVISKQEDVNMTVPINCKEATLVRNCNAIMTSTEYFRNYMGMYDQYKLNAVRASVEMTYIDNQLLNSATFPSICTAWDRNGIKVNSVCTTAANPDTQQAAVYNFELPQYSQVCSYSSANEKTLYYGARWGVIRQLDAASMMEKSIYQSTTNTRDVLTIGNSYSMWNPQLLISIKGARGVSVEQSVSFTIHWQFDITLRGLRKVGITDESFNSFKPNAGFIGYAPNNIGIAVQLDGHDTRNPQDFAVVGAPQQNAIPTINPCLDVANGQTGIVVPNTGYAGANIQI